MFKFCKVKVLRSFALSAWLNVIIEMSNRQCKNSPDRFRYVCGYYISKHTTYAIVKKAKHWTAYRIYFAMDMGDQDKAWAPHVICGTCRTNLEGWLRGSKVCTGMSFAVPRAWRELQNHHDDCYFRMINILKYSKVSGRRAMIYPSIASSIAPVPHNEALPAPTPPANVSLCKFIWVCDHFLICYKLALYYFR